jgi:uncharacterized protein (DUF305 family)
MNWLHDIDRVVTRRLALACIGLTLAVATPAVATAQGAATPTASPAATWSCDTIASKNVGEVHDHGAAEEHAHAEIEFDQLYIDMMIPHHGSIIALAEAALPHLTDPRLQQVAEAIIATQTAENAQLTEWRTAWYGSGEPASDEASMDLMIEAMPVGTMTDMMYQMDPGMQVLAFCAEENPDLGFVQQVIPHHQMAIDASEVAVEQAVHPELAAFAEDVITVQQAEIDLLNGILEELEPAGTPAA